MTDHSGEFVEVEGGGWCPIHGTALCPEDYMLRRDGTVSAGYAAHWSEAIRCGKRQPTYRKVSDIGRSEQP